MNRNVTATILIVVALGMYFTVTQGIYSDAQEVVKTNEGYITAIKNGQELIKVRDEVEHAFTNISQDDKDRIERMLPTTVDNIRLVIDLTNLASRHGFQLDRVQARMNATQTTPSSAPVAANIPATPPPGSPPAAPTLHSVTVGFSTAAPYQQFVAFLQDVEASLRLMDLTHLSVESKDDGKYDFIVEFETYYLAQ